MERRVVAVTIASTVTIDKVTSWYAGCHRRRTMDCALDGEREILKPKER
jgi:hypothetical protein